MEVNAVLTLPVAQAGDTTNLTGQDVIPIPPGVPVEIAIIMEVATKKQMGLKRNIIQIVMIPEFVVFQMWKKRVVPVFETPMAMSVNQLRQMIVIALLVHANAMALIAHEEE